MTTATLRVPSTPKIRYEVAVTDADPRVRLVIEAIRVAGQIRSWRKKDFLRGRAAWVRQFITMLRDLRRVDRATPAQLQGVLVAMENAGRAVILEGLPIVNDSLADALAKEQAIEGEENVDTIEVLAHPTPGNVRALRDSMLRSIEAQRHVVDVCDAMLLEMES